MRHKGSLAFRHKGKGNDITGNDNKKGEYYD